MITYQEAIQLITHYIHEDQFFQKAFLAESIMKKTAQIINEPVHLWRIVGLLYDLDWEYTKDQPEHHGEMTVEILEGLLPEEGLHAILAHNYIHTQEIPTTLLDKALIASDALTQLIQTITHPINHEQQNTRVNQTILYNHIKKPEHHHLKERVTLIEDIGLQTKEFIKLGIKSFNEIKKC